MGELRTYIAKTGTGSGKEVRVKIGRYDANRIYIDALAPLPSTTRYSRIYLSNSEAAAHGIEVPGEAEAAPEPAPVNPPNKFIGVQTRALWGGVPLSEGYIQLDLAKQLGANIVRMACGWSTLQSQAPEYFDPSYVSKVDSVISACEARGLKVLLTLSESPCWASSAPDSLKQNCATGWWNRGVQNYLPTNPYHYANALAWLIKRYGTRCFYEVWNEPNDPSYTKVPSGADPIILYAELLKAAYVVGKPVNPNVKIIGGALAHAAYDKTERLYRLGVKSHFDAWSVHPYSEGRSPLDPGDPNWPSASMIKGVPMVRAVMEKFGDGHKPIWLTEFGWSTSTPRTGDPTWAQPVTREQQAQYVREAIDLIQTWPYVEMASYYEVKDSGTADTRLDRYGLTDFANVKKPAFDSFRMALS